MLLAQALGEYVALSALVEAATNFSIFFEELIRAWGIEVLIALGAAAIVWRVVGAFR
jgi:hypothetical protein